ncbi:Acetoin utilization deacetylase AcuC [Desulfacinum infernum DSM 9756]|uniref:Acetoin utilization deacetylase AcuC n=1 Tax=Desulfacinum infernum DSM 9756 TaxID=1121391 RepID=A0A1M4UCK5_9BACT|nr:histone deacetylase family protein [Desulfacinum infernum]SHE54337.1 Acetoin utilization deacetylase AcuC [Desulfacinum infernum DSM 9756]
MPQNKIPVFTHEDFLEAYTHDPAAAPGRIEAVRDAISDIAEYREVLPASWEDIQRVHTDRHIQRVIREGLDPIASLAAGGAVMAALEGMNRPSFALIRPPGHHASADGSWGFCYYNNVAVALEHLKHHGLIQTAYLLDFDLHYGDGSVNILRDKGYAAILNPQTEDRGEYLKTVERDLARMHADIIAVSAGFDAHQLDWGGILSTRDYHSMGAMIREACRRLGIGCFAVLEGGYNHAVLGKNVRAFLLGLLGLPGPS